MNSSRVSYLLVFALFSCVALGNAHPNPAQISTLRDQWATNFKTKNLDRLVQLYDQDAELIRPNGLTVGGTSAIRDALKEILDSSDGSLMVLSDRCESSGDLAFDNGLIQYGVRGQQSPQKVLYLTVMKQVSTGKWVILRQAFI